MKHVLKSSGACLVILLLPSPGSGAQASSPAAGQNIMQPATAPARMHFVRLDAIDIARLVPPAPAPGSVAAQADLETVLQVQASRTPEQVTWAKTVEKDTLFNHASIVGTWLLLWDLPITTAFFKDISEDVRAFDAAAKKTFTRPRPSAVDPRVQPCIDVPASTSYPSGGAMQAYVWAEVLAELLPEKREALLDRAHRAAWGRVVGGIHFPSDLVAGQIMAQAYLAECRKSGAFRDALDTCRREIAVFSRK